MPPKTVTCSICGQEVMKSQTYATGETAEDGTPLRACKEHEGVVEKAEEMKAKHVKEMKGKGLNQAQRNAGPAFARYYQKTSDEQKQKDRDMLEDARSSLEKIQDTAEWGWTHCWCCEQPGLMLNEFYRLRLVAMEKMRLLGMDWNPFDQESIKNEQKLMRGLMEDMGKKCVMHRFEMNEQMRKKYEEWKLRINYKVRQLADLMGWIQLCFDCQKRTGIVFDLEENMPKVSLENLCLLGSLYAGSAMHESSKDLAKASAESDVKKSTERN